jgi:hypothetical protein
VLVVMRICGETLAFGNGTCLFYESIK